MQLYLQLSFSLFSFSSGFPPCHKYTTYSPQANSDTNWEGWRDGPSSGTYTNHWADGSIDVPSSPLADPGTENILTIGATVWRDDDTKISSISSSGLGGLITDALGGSCPGASVYSYGSAVTQTTVTWTTSYHDMVSGLLIQFVCSD